VLDRQRYYAIALAGRHSLLRRLKLWALYTNFRCVACYRFSQRAGRLYARNKLLGLVPRIISGVWRQRLLTKHHVMLDPAAQIGPGLYVMHEFGLIVGPVTIGANCVLHQNVTIGQRVGRGDQTVPSLGNNVWIGPGATLTGAITVGDNVTISAGTVLSKSVPDGCLVAGNPGRVIQANYDNSLVMGVLVPFATGAGNDDA
jgi:serine O-acetyltransferase